MIRNLLAYFCLFGCLFCNAMSTPFTENIDPRQINMFFYDCDSAFLDEIQCGIQNITCIQRVHDQLKKDKRETTIYIHGFRSGRNIKPAPELVSSYCSRKLSIIAVIDWSKLSSNDAIMTINRIPNIARIISATFNSLYKEGYNVTKWHIIGHSLGAHIAGCVGNFVHFTFSHITGLDPALVVYHTDLYKGCTYHPEVAHFTDAIYTDRGGYATHKDIAKLNIYVNMGTAPQPGCSSSSNIHQCSHVMAGEWYANAVRNETKYSITKCVDCMLFQYFNLCETNDRIHLTPHMNPKKRGLYCLSID